MLRVPVMSPADTTGRLLEALDAEPGVRNVVVLRVCRSNTLSVSPALLPTCWA